MQMDWGPETHIWDQFGTSIPRLVRVHPPPAHPQRDDHPSRLQTALDATARSQYQRRIAELQEQLDEAEEFSDLGRADVLRAELDALTQELAGAFGLGGRQRRTGSDAERARVNVRRRIKDAIDRIAENNADIGRYLKNTIKTGTYCKYTPM